MFGKRYVILNVLQLSAAFAVRYYFLWSLSKRLYPERSVTKGLLIWGSLGMVTFPFAMQCHLAALPCSLISSLFLLMLSYLFRDGKGKKRLVTLLLAAVCAGLMMGLSGAVDGDRRSVPGSSIPAAMASRLAWPTLWVDHEAWTEELQEITGEVLWEANYYPGNMAMVCAAIEEKVSFSEAEAYYRQMAEVAWNYHAPMIIRQIGWDILGYAMTPVIFPLQMEGEAYDSYSGRNYEVMRSNAPLLTRYYVEYGCWWFGCGLIMALMYTLLGVMGSLGKDGEGNLWKRAVFPMAVSILASGILVVLLTMRGAGIMDYKDSVAVNELWIAWPLLCLVWFSCREKRVPQEEGIGQ